LRHTGPNGRDIPTENSAHERRSSRESFRLFNFSSVEQGEYTTTPRVTSGASQNSARSVRGLYAATKNLFTTENTEGTEKGIEDS